MTEEQKQLLEELQDELQRIEKEIEDYEPDPDTFEEQYDEVLDETYPAYKIGSGVYPASHVLKELDRIAYDTGLNDFVDTIEKDDDPHYQELLDERDAIADEIEELEDE